LKTISIDEVKEVVYAESNGHMTFPMTV